MSDALEKLKQGVNQTSKQAKTAVESNRLNNEINNKRKEMDTQYINIGKIVFQSYKENDFSVAENKLKDILKELLLMEETIEIMEEKIKELKNVKVCVCGKISPLDSKFCPSCGHKFIDSPETAVNGSVSQTEELALGNDEEESKLEEAILTDEAGNGKEE